MLPVDGCGPPPGLTVREVSVTLSNLPVTALDSFQANPNLSSRGEGFDAAPTLWRLGHGGSNGYE